jgi:hypothetical protein
MDSKFKVGEVLRIKENCALTAKACGWPKDTTIKITKVRQQVYEYIYLQCADDYWVQRNEPDQWNHNLIDDNFQLDKIGTVLYGHS